MSALDPHLVAIATGDHDAFAAWMAGAEHRIRASLSSFATAVDTEAVLQECLLRVWQVAPKIKPDGKPDSLTRFAIRVARNLAISEIRRRRPGLLTDHMLDDTFHEHDDAPDPHDPELRATITDCFDRLPERPRLAIAARLAGAGNRDATMARTVGMTTNTFLHNIRRARLALADCLRQHGIDLG